MLYYFSIFQFFSKMAAMLNMAGLRSASYSEGQLFIRSTIHRDHYIHNLRNPGSSDWSIIAFIKGHYFCNIPS